MPALFYQRYWSILGEDVTKADQSIVNKKSPFLFLLATEALSRLLAKEEALGNIHGIKMNGGGPSFTRLLFANDLFLFPKATDYNLRAIFSHLETCQRWLGQSIKRSNPTIFFSSDMPNAAWKYMCQMLLLQKGQLNNSKCVVLAIPNRSDFHCTSTDQILYNCSRSWTKSQARWPRGNPCSSHNLVALFLWSPWQPRSYIYYVNLAAAQINLQQTWFPFEGLLVGIQLTATPESVGTSLRPKESGGLGFRRMIDHNRALLPKQAWKIATTPSSPMP